MRIPWKIQLGLVACAYVAVLGLGALLVFMRYLQYVNHPADAAAYSGMWAGGDLALGFIIGVMLLFVTFFLVLVIYKYEAAYTNYSKVLLAISVSLPVSIGLIAIPALSQASSILGYACLYRVFASPLVLAGFAMSRAFARFAGAKRLTNYALLTEGLTLVFMFAMLILPVRFHRP